ncbi:hypothetical protein MLD38_019326 [Melastoma candidum]|uniref:Uncharacterized protein n=1 Tax=Melastoma candidum TaxID=119954 RepID=A0ACB9QWQ7_9MYRT|nr:hypothetical protein MLD38_019326 [Melastoma candidum]
MLTSSDWSSNKSEYLGCQIIGRGLVPFLISVMLYTIVIIPLYVLGCGHVIGRLWSDKMGSFNVVYYSFREGLPRKGCTSSRYCCAFFSFITEKLGVADAVAKFRYVSKASMDKDIWKFTCGILKERAFGANVPDKVREVYEARGELALKDKPNDLKRYATDFEYDQIVIFWHVATEICYNMDPNLDKNNENVRFSKILSDYVIYLLVNQPDMMSAVAGIFHKRYGDICSELKQLEQRVTSWNLEIITMIRACRC